MVFIILTTPVIFYFILKAYLDYQYESSFNVLLSYCASAALFLFLIVACAMFVDVDYKN